MISVDWPAGTEWFLPSYYTAVGNVPYVGQDTALLLKSLVTHKALDLKDVHFIGHSLGAHAAGLSSKPFHGKIGRISGKFICLPVMIISSYFKAASHVV